MDIDLDLIMANIDNPGLIVNKRASVQIPKEPRVFPDYGKGYCVYCGVQLPKFKRLYCCDSHGWSYRSESSEYIWVFWTDFRDAIIKRDNNTCGECGVNAREYNTNVFETRSETYRQTIQLDVHHIVPLHNGGREFNPDNCITLCNGCHKKKHIKRVLEPTDTSRQLQLDIGV